MKYKEVIIGLLLAILLGAIEFLMVKYNIYKGLFLFLIFLFCLTKVLYVVIRCFRRIVTIAHTDMPYHRFLLFVAANVSLLVFSFSLDYYAIFSYDPTSFIGLEDTNNVVEEYFKLFYLSLLLFTNMGVANVVPVKIPAEILVMFEAIVSFVTLIFILSDYITLRDSLKRLKKGKKE